MITIVMCLSQQCTHHLQTEDSTTNKDTTQDGPANLDTQIGREQEVPGTALDETEEENGINTARV